MGRPFLKQALESLCLQDHPALEVIVVDATGGEHPPLPDLHWPDGHEVRLVNLGRQLPRPHAANAGLLAATGEWLCFLDDDDRYDANFVSAMLAQVPLHPDRLVLYGVTRVLDENGQILRHFGVPFNRAIMGVGPLFYWQSALIRRSVVDLGCRFDESLPVCEDRDFLAQIATHSDFAFVPVTATNYGLTTGTSGTTVGANRHPEKHIPLEALLRAKWAGETVFHLRRAGQGCRRAVAAFAAGDIAESRIKFTHVLATYPDDPNALHGLARLALADGEDLTIAKTRVQRALEILPTAYEFQLTLATIEEAQKDWAAARTAALIAAQDPIWHARARELLQRLPEAESVQQPYVNIMAPNDRSSATTMPRVSRLAPCPCGSGKRYKDCHGNAAGGAPSTTAAPAKVDPCSAAIHRAKQQLESGEADVALGLLEAIPPGAIDNAELATLAGEMLLECGHLEQAAQWLCHALSLNPDATAGAALNQCSEMQTAAIFAASAYRKVAQLRATMRLSQSAPPRDPTVHILATFASIGGAERHALNLYDTLLPHIPVQLWSTGLPQRALTGNRAITQLNPERGVFPQRGTMILLGQYFDYGDWMEKTNIERVVISVSLDQPRQLLERVTDLAMLARTLDIDFTYPSQLFQDKVGLPGVVEYSMSNASEFAPRSVAPDRPAAGFVVGRYSRDERLKHHPNDPSFFRQLTRRGHRVRLMGATTIARSLSRGSADPRIEILSVASQSARDFLHNLDCFIYRAHPHLFETGGIAVAEAMLAGLPVIAFEHRLGMAELIHHGVNGFLVKSEAQALEIVDALATDPARCHAIGAAARQSMLQTFTLQHERVVAFYRTAQAE